MTAKKKTAAAPRKRTTVRVAEAAPRRFRVVRAFGVEGVYYANHNADRINDLSDFEVADRIERGHIVEQRQRAPVTTEKE